MLFQKDSLNLKSLTIRLVINDDMSTEETGY